jgi:LysM repeat protein
MMRLLLLCAVLAVSGCMVRTYEITQQRPDQDLTQGNRGALQGRPPEVDPNRPTTRQMRVIEVVPMSQSGSQSAQSRGRTGHENAAVPERIVIPAQKYTVERNDTLQKISRKFYGTIHSWTKIYNANRPVLKSPDSLKPGQVLDIPEHEKQQDPGLQMKEAEQGGTQDKTGQP